MRAATPLVPVNFNLYLSRVPFQIWLQEPLEYTLSQVFPPVRFPHFWDVRIIGVTMKMGRSGLVPVHGYAITHISLMSTPPP
jgi:hypothetical protein